MITMIQQYKLIRVTCIASMTFESMGSEDSEISSIM